MCVFFFVLRVREGTNSYGGAHISMGCRCVLSPRWTGVHILCHSAARLIRKSPEL